MIFGGSVIPEIDLSLKPNHKSKVKLVQIADTRGKDVFTDLD